MTRLLTVVVVCFYFCWLPVYVSSVMMYLKLGERLYKYRNFYYLFPVFASSAVNPIVYGVMNQRFRKEFVKIIRSLCTQLQDIFQFQ